jgi:hypothetical protein
VKPVTGVGNFKVRWHEKERRDSLFGGILSMKEVD